MNNDHLLNNDHLNCEHKVECRCFPKYYKEEGYPLNPESYKDVPGWINDADFIYKEMVDMAEDGDHFVEIGTLLGQSATRMAELIKRSRKKIKFDTIDLFWSVQHIVKHYWECGHPYQFRVYMEELEKLNADCLDVSRHPLRHMNLLEYVNFITCDEKYAYRLYDNNSLKFVWIDGDHGPNVVYNHLVNFWPKLKKGGVIGGDDIEYGDVLHDVKKFTKEKNIKITYSYNGFKLIK